MLCTAGRARNRSLLVAAVLAALVSAVAPAATPRAEAAEPFDVLQVNLCNSGVADCYTGGERPVAATSAIVKERAPDVVTVNEVCAKDITRLARETGYHPEFVAAGDESSGEPYRCTEGRGDYGVATLTHPDLGATTGNVVQREYAAQDDGAEQRVMLCVPFSTVGACTTHLSAADGAVAAEQCGELLSAASALDGPVVIGGDLNLRHGGSPDVQDCVPEGWFRKGDGGVQHVMARSEFGFERTEKLAVDGTDHPGFLVTLTR